MTTIKATVRNGRIEADRLIDLPDGTELTIPIPDKLTLPDNGDDVPEPPEVIEAWLRWFDSLEPVEFTAEERAAWDAARRQQKDFELADWERRSKKIESQLS